MRTTPKGLVVWDLDSDQFDHNTLADNFDLIDDLLDEPPNQIEAAATLPASGNFAGRVVFLSAADGGFPAHTVMRFGTDWRPVGNIEIQPAVPSTGNFPGRVVVLSSASGNFAAWDVIRYNGTSWDLIGGFQVVNTGAEALNIRGVQTANDIYINNSARGLVLVDRNSGNKFRIYLSGGSLEYETVT